MKIKGIGLLIVAVSLMGQGCTSTRPLQMAPPPLPLAGQLPDVLRAEEASALTDRFSVPDSGRVLRLPQALQLALLKNPELSAFSLEVRIHEALVLQASLPPNPELDLEAENFGGEGDSRGLAGGEYTLQIGQLIELAGKRKKRKHVAEMNGCLAGWDYEARRLDVYVEVTRAFVRTLVAQERVALAGELVKLAESFVENIRRRVQAGKDSPAELARAQVELSGARVALQRAQKELLTARIKLAATWGADRLRFQRVEGELKQTVSLPPLNMLNRFLAQNPDVARWAAEQALWEARLQLERAQQIPDPVLAAGIRHLQGDGTTAFVAGVSVPLPVFDRNQGNVQAARYRVLQVRKQREAASLLLTVQLAERYHRLRAVAAELDTLRQRSLPSAEQAFTIIREGFLSGRFGFLDVLDAQRTLFEVRSRYLDALAEFHQSVAALERLIGRRIDDLR